MAWNPATSFQFLLRQLLQHLESGTLVALRKHNVKADDGDLVMVEQLVEQKRQAVARPRPAALAAFFPLGEAFFIDIEYDDARIDGARHRQREPRVVNNRLQTGRPAAAGNISPRDPETPSSKDEAQADAYDVFFQTASAAAVSARE